MAVKLVMSLLVFTAVSFMCFVGADVERMFNRLGWVWYVWVQLVMGAFMVIGWLLLIPFCLARAWIVGANSRFRLVDKWRWEPLNWIYSNFEDGVSGQQALVWNAAGTEKVPYMPTPDPPFEAWNRGARLYVRLWDAWRAYCWSAWRNSCDGLKYAFAWDNGPQAMILGHKIGWWLENGQKVPVL